jgi:hypothetical protein
MSNDFEDDPLVFPDSDTEKNRGDRISDDSDVEPVTGYEWTPDSLELMAHHGIDPDSLENDEDDDEGDDDELEPGEFPTRLSCQHFHDSEPLA